MLQQAKEAFDYVDKDGSGNLSFDEFLSALRVRMIVCVCINTIV